MYKSPHLLHIYLTIVGYSILEREENMTKYQLIMQILSISDDYTAEQLLKLWYAELKILLHHLQEEKGKEKIYDIE